MEITLVKNPARRNGSGSRRRANPKGYKNDGKARKCRVCNRKGHNARTCPKKGHSKKSRVKSKGVGRGKAKRTCGKCGRAGHNARSCSNKAKASKSRGRKKSTRGRKSKARRNPRRNSVNVVEKMPVIGKMKIAKTADSEIAPMAHGAQNWKSASMTQKAVQVVGGWTGYGYGGSFAQMGQNFSENALIGSGVGVITGVGGIAASSWAVNQVFGDMLMKKHEGKHHTFANFTKGWKYGGYVGVGLNTITNLLTMYYGRSYSGLGSWSNLVNEAKYGNMAGAVKKMVAKSVGAHKLAHLPAVAGAIGQGMYATGPDGPLQGFAFGDGNLATGQNASIPGHPGAMYGADAYTDVDGYYGDNNDVLGYVDVLGGRAHGNPVGGVDTLGYPSGIGYPAEFAENQPLYS